MVDAYPLSKYVIIAQRLFDYFQESYENKNINEAYVYGIRFAQFGLVNLPKYREWEIGGEVEANIKSQFATVRSRLKTIKRRMDEEELRALGWKMMADAKEEIQEQDRFHREQKRRLRIVKKERNRFLKDLVPHLGEERTQRPERTLLGDKRARFKNGVESTRSLSDSNKNQPQSIEGKVKSKLKLMKLLRSSTKTKVPKKTSTARMEATPITSNVNTNSNSSKKSTKCGLPVLLSRAQHELLNKTKVKTTVAADLAPPTTHYTIDEFPVVEEVTLKLHSTRTPSLCSILNVQYALASGYTIQAEPPISHEIKLLEILEEVNEGNKSINFPASERSSLQPSFPSQIVYATVVSDQSDEISLPTVDGVERNANETREQLSKDSESEKVDALEAKLCSSSSTSPDSVGTKQSNAEQITDSLPLTHTEDAVNCYKLVINEIMTKTSTMYTGHHHIAESMPECNHTLTEEVECTKDVLDCHQLVTNELSRSISSIAGSRRECNHRSIDEGEYADYSLTIKVDSLTIKDVFQGDDSLTNKDESLTKIDVFQGEPDSTSTTTPCDSKTTWDQQSTIDENAKNQTHSNFHKFDAFLASNAQIEKEEKSYDEFTVTDDEDESYVGESYLEDIIEEDTDSEGSYFERTMIEEDENNEGSCFEHKVAENSRQCLEMNEADAVKVTEVLEGSPSCVQNVNEFENLHDYFSIYSKNNVVLSSVDDTASMTYSVDDSMVYAGSVGEGSVEDSKQRLKTILHKDLWKGDVTTVETSMMELNEMVKYGASSSRVLIAEFGGVMAIIRTMTRFPDKENIQFLCCAALMQLASEPENRTMIKDMDAVPLMSQSMTNHPSSQRIHDSACATLSLLYAS